MPRHRKTQKTNLDRRFVRNSADDPAVRQPFNGRLESSPVCMFCSNICCLHTVSRQRFEFPLKYFVHLRVIGATYSTHGTCRGGLIECWTLSRPFAV
jgi:hypothetical protein